MIKKTPSVNYNGRCTDIITYQSNDRYWRAHKEFHNKFGKIDEYPYYKIEHEGFIWGFHVDIRINGIIKINISSCGLEDRTYNKLLFFDDYNYNFLYNGKLDIDCYKKAVINEIEKRLFAPGLFRTIQSIHGITKKDVPRYYKLYKPDLKKDYDEEDIIKHIRKYYNIDITNVYFESAIRWINKNKTRYKELMVMLRFDYSFIYDFEGDIDEAEGYFWEEMDNYPKNTILI